MAGMSSAREAWDWVAHKRQPFWIRLGAVAAGMLLVRVPAALTT